MKNYFMGFLNERGWGVEVMWGISVTTAFWSAWQWKIKLTTLKHCIYLRKDCYVTFVSPCETCGSWCARNFVFSCKFCTLAKLSVSHRGCV